MPAIPFGSVFKWIAEHRIAFGIGMMAISAVGFVASLNIKWCGARSITPEARISACTRLINAGAALGVKLPSIYDNRGHAHAADREYSRAIADYDEAIRRDPNYANAFNNRGNAHMASGDFAWTLADFDAALRLDPTTTFGRKNRGYAHFLTADYGASAADLAEAVQQKRDDPYPALWLFLARVRTGNPKAAAELESNTKTLKPGEWPRAVVELLLGQAMPDATRAAARNSDERCEADFYAGEWHLMRRDRETATASFKAAADTCPAGFIERAGARAELKRLQP